MALRADDVVVAQELLLSLEPQGATRTFRFAEAQSAEDMVSGSQQGLERRTVNIECWQCESALDTCTVGRLARSRQAGGGTSMEKRLALLQV